VLIDAHTENRKREIQKIGKEKYEIISFDVKEYREREEKK